MKKFEFRFETVEKARKVQAEKQRRKVAEASQKVQRLEKEQAHIRKLIQREKKRMEEMIRQHGFVDHHFHELSMQYRQQMVEKDKKKATEVLHAKQDLVRQQRFLVEKAKKKKAMEILREREEERFYDEQEKRESKEMDEISSTFWLHHHR